MRRQAAASVPSLAVLNTRIGRLQAFLHNNNQRLFVGNAIAQERYDTLIREVGQELDYWQVQAKLCASKPDVEQHPTRHRIDQNIAEIAQKLFSGLEALERSRQEIAQARREASGRVVLHGDVLATGELPIEDVMAAALADRVLYVQADRTLDDERAELVPLSVEHPLIPHGLIERHMFNQGSLGNCFFLGTMMTLASTQRGRHLIASTCRDLTGLGGLFGKEASFYDNFIAVRLHTDDAVTFVVLQKALHHTTSRALNTIPLISVLERAYCIAARQGDWRYFGSGGEPGHVAKVFFPGQDVSIEYLGKFTKPMRVALLKQVNKGKPELYHYFNYDKTLVESYQKCFPAIRKIISDVIDLIESGQYPAKTHYFMMEVLSNNIAAHAARLARENPEAAIEEANIENLKAHLSKLFNREVRLRKELDPTMPSVASYLLFQKIKLVMAEGGGAILHSPEGRGRAAVFRSEGVLDSGLVGPHAYPVGGVQYLQIEGAGGEDEPGTPALDLMNVWGRSQLTPGLGQAYEYKAGKIIAKEKESSFFVAPMEYILKNFSQVTIVHVTADYLAKNKAAFQARLQEAGYSPVLNDDIPFEIYRLMPGSTDEDLSRYYHLIARAIHATGKEQGRRPYESFLNVLAGNAIALGSEQNILKAGLLLQKYYGPVGCRDHGHFIDFAMKQAAYQLLCQKSGGGRPSTRVLCAAAEHSTFAEHFYLLAHLNDMTEQHKGQRAEAFISCIKSTGGISDLLTLVLLSAVQHDKTYMRRVAEEKSTVSRFKARVQKTDYARILQAAVNQLEPRLVQLALIASKEGGWRVTREEQSALLSFIHVLQSSGIHHIIDSKAGKRLLAAREHLEAVQEPVAALGRPHRIAHQHDRASPDASARHGAEQPAAGARQERLEGKKKETKKRKG